MRAEAVSGDVLAHKVFSALALRPRLLALRQRSAALKSLLRVVSRDHHAVSILATSVAAVTSVSSARLLRQASRPLSVTLSIRERKAVSASPLSI